MNHLDSNSILHVQWNLSFATPLFKGHLHSEDAKFGRRKMFTYMKSLYLLHVPLLRVHLYSGERDTLSRSLNPNLTLSQDSKSDWALKIVDKLNNLHPYHNGNNFQNMDMNAAWNNDCNRFQERILKKWLFIPSISPFWLAKSTRLIHQKQPWVQLTIFRRTFGHTESMT